MYVHTVHRTRGQKTFYIHAQAHARYSIWAVLLWNNRKYNTIYQLINITNVWAHVRYNEFQLNIHDKVPGCVFGTHESFQREMLKIV